MSGELSFHGVFVSALLVWALVALGLSVLIRRVLRAVHFYRWVWHPALFDLSLFVILWCAVTALAFHAPLP
ncbi:DUF1656 domain-containing protein [Pyxidicoccus parkwayensis]|uniref:DUF1656 domain-containing protein n=1 Tax=Pyxidicoccus parkwayensis TaxID=2813578 RepID=A0ABX7P8A2_9BACT|nr:DUF1656 domain-containing protein [Pyxidicoccus parkwaysis]QSQ26668.1 DUF1656 domain-containing protein [Pyxidicoccus parkwaysis]